MAGLAVITDSGAGFPKEWYEQHGILVAQHSVIFPNEEPQLDFGIAPEEFYGRLIKINVHPKTSSPNPAQFDALYNAAFSSGASKVLVLTPVKELNSVYNAATSAARGHSRKNDIIVADTHTAGPAQGLVALEVRRYFGAHELDGIEKRVEDASGKSRVYVVPYDLNYLESSGRVDAIKLMVSSLLSIKPVVSIMHTPKGYKAGVISKSRTMNGAISQVVKLAEGDVEAFKAQGLEVVDVAFVHANNVQGANGLEEQIVTAIKQSGLTMKLAYSGLMSPVLGRQFGPRAVGVAMLYRTG